MKRTLTLFALTSLCAPYVAAAGTSNLDTGTQERTPAGDRDIGLEQAPTDVLPTVRGKLTLRSHDVDVVINNGFASTTIEQVLENTTNQPLEATWSFPLPEDASLSEFALWIDGIPHVGEVAEKDQAKAIHEAEKRAGESSALAEQNGFVDYRLTVSPVPARGSARVRVVYYEPLTIDQGVGRYLYPLQNGNTDDLAMDPSFWSMEKEVSDQMTIDVRLKTAFPITGLHSPSHATIQTTQEAADLWQASWSGSGPVLDKDFVLYYRLADDVPARVELLTSRYADQGEGTFMAVITPGEDLKPITHGTDWMFVLDVSGSMKGDKLRVLKQGVARAISTLRTDDRFQVIAFNDRHEALASDWTLVGTTDAERAIEAVRSLKAHRGTNIFGALDAAYDRLDADRPSAIVLVSDGVANTGPHEYRDFIDMAKTHDGRLFTFVIGNGANETLLGDLASLSGGFARSVSVQDEVGAHLMLARERMSHEALHGVEFRLDGATSTHPIRLPSLYLGQQLVVFGRYQGAGSQKLTVSARISGEDVRWTVPVVLPRIDESNPELERLYAMAAIEDLERAEWLDGRTESETREGIVDMALAYSLVTDHTSMVVVREDRKAQYGLGSENLNRRMREEDAARVRSIAGNQVQVQTGGAPLAGPKAANAPARERQRGSAGGGALGPLELLTLFALIGLAAAGRVR